MASLLVLIAASGSNAIDEAVVRKLTGYGAGRPHWLHEGEACEMDVFPDLSQFLADIKHLPIDAAIVSSDSRRKRLLIADMDSTMIHQECIDELAEAAGRGAEVKAITARAMRGEMDFEQALEARVAQLAGLPVSVIDGLLKRHITLMEGGPTLLATMRANGAYAALVSGGFTRFTGPIAGRLGFDEHRANVLQVAQERLTGTVQHPILGQQAKLQALREITAQRGIALTDAIAVGDGANDLAMLSEAGLGVALHAKPLVQADSLIRINHGDLTALLYLQGYRRSQFVSPPK